MEKYLFAFVGGIALNLFCIVCWHKLMGKKVDFKDYKFYLAILILDLISTIINFTIPHFLKVGCNVIMMFIINYIFFCKNTTKNILVILFYYLIIFVSEFILILGFSLFIGEGIYKFSESSIGLLVVNIGVSIMSFAFLQFKFIYKFFNYLIKTFDNMKKSNLLIYFVLTIALISIFYIMVHMSLPITFLLICDAVLTLFYIIMLFRLANAREGYKSVSNKYETSLSSLREYEDIMDKYRVSNHENKNQLLTIRNMLNKKDKETIAYIDKLVDNKIKDNETIFYKTSKIPEGGLRAIIYSKLCKMKDMKIKYDLDIANDVKTVDLLKIGDSTTLNICKVLGVFLDNAIEAVENIKKKHIIIEIFVMDGYLCIDVSNNYDGNIELEKLGNKKYSTKGKGHGYGLSLVNDIIKNDSNLEHETKISKEMFTQRLKIKM